MTKSLYNINQEILNFMDREEFTEEEYSDFKNLQADKETKLENIHKFILNLESDNVWPEAEIQRLQKIIKSNNSKIESLKRLVNDTLDGEAWNYDLWWFSYRKSIYKSRNYIYIVVRELWLNKRYNSNYHTQNKMNYISIHLDWDL